MAELDLVELRGLLERATPRPWEHRKHGARQRITGDQGLTVAHCPVGHMTKHHEDAALIVAVVNVLPALLSRLEQHSPVSDGWRLVPVEPTDDMVAAGWLGRPGRASDWVDGYRAMLSASPPPPGGRGRDEGGGGSVGSGPCLECPSCVDSVCDHEPDCPHGLAIQAALDAEADAPVDLPGWETLSDGQRADIAAHVRGLSDGPGTYALDRPPRSWCCFHCGEAFRTEEGARLHFGETPIDQPHCLKPQCPTCRGFGLARGGTCWTCGGTGRASAFSGEGRPPAASDGEARQIEGLRGAELKDNKDSQALSAIRGEGAALSNGSDHDA